MKRPVGRPKGSYRRRYSVYERGTDRPLCIYGTTVECAKVLGVAPDTLYTYVCRIRQGHRMRKYDIYIDDEEDIEE